MFNAFCCFTEVSDDEGLEYLAQPDQRKASESQVQSLQSNRNNYLRPFHHREFHIAGSKNVHFFKYKIVIKQSADSDPDQELTDAAATAQSLQPRGFTLETTDVSIKSPSSP